MTDDERGLMMLEKSIYEAQAMLEKEHTFRPFAMLLDTEGNIERLENSIENMRDAYQALYEEIKLCVEEKPIDIIVLLSDVTMPENIGEEGVESGIRVHLEERSQQHKKIAGRYIYVPYQLQRLAGEEQIYVKLFAPAAVSFPSEFLREV
ncbi:MAG: hypothetical protein B5M46_02215 [Epsilonproteobacteria bacterium 4484_20]|nr:MAG: hypothetical protein B5M46_02215 [Epsilonproteobacteria bacterium 4484_20]